MAGYAITIFLSAFLLFQVQLLLGKYILPWYGGVPAVWTTCMLFFQSLLLLGYAYAHWLGSRPSLARQRAIHLGLVGLSLAMLGATTLLWGWPLLPDDTWRPASGDRPIIDILGLLAVSVGIPFLTLAATAPLLQRWLNLTSPATQPYRLYAVSNAGSLIGLVSYPLVVGLLVPLHPQAVLWTALYTVFAAGLARIAFRLGKATPKEAAAAAMPAASHPPRLHYALSFGFAACASALLLATTNQMSQEAASVPFLWMVPLALYLLTFILCFESDRWYVRPLYLSLLVPALALATLLFERGYLSSLHAQISIYSGTLFVLCMVCHGELARLRPSPRHLTSFYLTISAGGAAGGLFVGVVAPNLFPGFWEFPIALWMIAALVFIGLLKDPESPLRRFGAAPAYLSLFAAVLVGGFIVADPLQTDVRAFMQGQMREAQILLLLGIAAVVVIAYLGVHLTRRKGYSFHAGLQPTSAVLAVAILLYGLVQVAVARGTGDRVVTERNFFGAVQVLFEWDQSEDRLAMLLLHGRTLHGMQYVADARGRCPTIYYGGHSGIALVMRHHPGRDEARERGLRVGVIGLGTGTLAAYGRENDYFRFYEINPAIIRLALGQHDAFSYLSETPARVDVVAGDARISLERELARGNPQAFHVLAVDAFNSGSIPLHLLTREAFETYLRHLDPAQGVLAIHISNRYLDLRPILQSLAKHFHLNAVVVEADHEETWSSTWMLMSASSAVLDQPAIRAAASPLRDPRSAPLWRDDYSNLLHALNVRSRPSESFATEGDLVELRQMLNWLPEEPAS